MAVLELVFDRRISIVLLIYGHYYLANWVVTRIVFPASSSIFKRTTEMRMMSDLGEEFA
jgi:hypothetical protein